jgi:RNA polymerase sigma-70 factor (ECF subfamily)
VRNISKIIFTQQKITAKLKISKELIFFPTFVKKNLFNIRKISALSDEELLYQHISSGDATYFGELYNRYIPLLYGVCLKYLGNADEAQDAVMQIFEDVLPKISRYEVSTFRTWIYSVAKNHCLQQLRHPDKEILMDFDTQIMESDEILHLLNEGGEEDERLPALQKCIEKLPEHQREAVIRFFYEEMSYQDIAETMIFDVKKVKSFIQNGKRNLKICIEK